MRLRHRAILTLTLLWACKGPATETDTDTDTVDTDDTDDTDTDTDDTIAPPEGDPATVELLGTCPRDQRWGGFRIDNGEDFGFVDGSVLAGVIPATIPSPVDASGDCRLDQKVNPFCDPPCPGDQTCSLANECIPFPAAQDLGTVEVAGSNPSVRIDPFVPGYNYSNTAVSNPPVDPDALVELRIPDSPWGALNLHGVGVQALVPSGDTLVVRDDADLEVTWTPSTGLGRSTVFFELNIDQHGNSPVLLTCEFDDDGTGTVPVTLITQLINAGVTGFPSARITRHTADRTTVGGDGCVELDVTSQRVMGVSVDGYTPCNGPGQCPPPQECNLALEICE
ncbi:MAG: hypothetical protein H6737_10225 [Alphaproteobacteria bacterium]|nr:hypothetical protein [Alphaproteobacteria bacterium]